MASHQKGHHTRAPRKWDLDFSKGSQGSRGQQSDQLAPIGFVLNPGRAISETSRQDVDPNLVVKRGWDIALGPVKQIPMNLFIMWMAGNTISIFPIMMVGMMFFRPIQALLTSQNVLKMIEGSQAIFQKAVYLLGNILCLLLAVYKCQTMGLLPTHASDWLAFAESPKRLEWSGGGMML